ncbi:MAG TPA: GTPase [Pirellulaceae bacterium]|jgi:tRNA modification GTPase
MTTSSAAATDEAWRFCVLTPAGRGAIATIGVSDPASLAAIQRLFAPANRRDLSSYDVDSAVFGRFRSSDGAPEDVVVGIFANDEAEIHCHGGQVAVAAICEVLIREGGIQVSPADWVRRQADDVIAAEALLALAEAQTERMAAILLDQYRGAFRRALEFVARFLEQGDRSAASQTINELISRADLGLHLARPWKIVITGRPNVGKSSLMNAVLGYQRSLVWHQPGTTRDVLTATTAIDGWWVELSDVAGLRTSGDALEAAGVERAEHAIAAADLVVFVADLTADWEAELYRRVCERIAATDIARPPIIVHNKCDVAGTPSADRPTGIKTSAINGVGLSELCQAISKSLVPSPPDEGTAIPFTQDHVRHLQEAVAALERGDVSAACDSIQSLTDSRHA